MKNINSVALLVLALSVGACNPLAKMIPMKSVKAVSDFTPSLTPEVPNRKVTLPAARHLNSWTDLNSNHQQTENIQVHDINKGSKKYNIANIKQLSASPIIVDKKLFLLDENSKLVKIDLATFKQEYSLDLGGKKNKKYQGGGISYDHGKLYIVNGELELKVINAHTGQKVNELYLPDIIKVPPVIVGNVVLVLTINNQLIALDKHNLATLWRHQALPKLLVEHHAASPIVHQGQVIVPFYSGELAALNLQHGHSNWIMQSGNDNNLSDFTPTNIVSQLISDHDSIYFSNASGGVTKVHALNGHIIWSNNIQDVQTMNKFGDIIVALTNARQAVAFSAIDGKIIWVQNIHAYTQKSQLNKTVKFFTPLLINDALTIATNNGKIYQLDITNGQIFKESQVAADIQAIMADHDYFYVLTKGKLLAFY